MQIGAIIIDTETLRELDYFSVFVKPTIHPALSDFFIHLTNITQEEVERNGVLFGEALERFLTWAGDLPMYSWGRDPLVLRENCELYHIPFSVASDRFFDMRNVFKRAGIEAEKYASSTIIEAFGKESPFRAHNGLSDARSILEGLRELQKPTSFLHEKR